jgi:uncharacterized protein
MAVSTHVRATTSGAAHTAARDFPFHDGRPVALTGRQWALLLLAVAVGALADLVVAVPGPGWLSVAVRGVLFAGIPLAVLTRVVPGALGSLFHRVRGRDIALMVGVAAVNVAVTTAVGVVLAQLTHLHANAAAGEIAALGAADRVAYFLGMVPQLLGEEVVTVLPFLALLTFVVRLLRAPRWAGITVAWVGSAVLFALLHLPTYGGNLLQCLAVIGVARLVLFVPYLLTKNLWTSTGAHVLNDWALFGTSLLLPA